MKIKRAIRKFRAGPNNVLWSNRYGARREGTPLRNGDSNGGREGRGGTATAEGRGSAETDCEIGRRPSNV